MAVVKMLKRVANPRRATKRVSRRASTSSRVRGAGGKFVATSSKRKPIKRRKTTRRNPALLVTLGAVNPHKGTKTVARKKTRRAVNPRRRKTSRRRRNTATKIVVMAPAKRRTVSRRGKRRNPSIRRTRRRSFSRRRNPNILGMQVTSMQGIKLIAGGLVGVTATKAITSMLPPVIISSGLFRILASGGVAFLSGLLASRVDSTFGSAVAFGGYMQTGSLALNTFIPTIGSRFSLGALMPAEFSVPQNPISGAYLPEAGPQTRITTNGLTRAYGRPAL